MIKLERSRTAAVLLVDSGDTFVGSAERDSADTLLLAEAMNRMGYDAMALGEKDMANGVDALQPLAEIAKFPFLGANLRWQGDGRSIWKPYVLLNYPTRKVAVIGIIGQSLMSQSSLSKAGQTKISVSDPFEALRQAIREARASTRTVIVLSHMGFEEDVRLAREVEGLTAIVGAHTKNLGYPPLVAQPNGTVVVQAGFNGEYLGALRLLIDPAGRASVQSATLIELGPDVGEDEEMRAWLGERRARP